MTRADEWHIKVSDNIRRRFKANAALHRLTLGQNLERLLEQDEVSPQPVRVADERVRQEQSGSKNLQANAATIEKFGFRMKEK